MLEKDDRRLIERDRGAGDVTLDVDIGRLLECQAPLNSVIDLANAFTSYRHLGQSRDPYEGFKRLGHVDLESQAALGAPVAVDHLGGVEPGELVIVSVKGSFHTLARVERVEDGDARLRAVSPLDR
jgi:hypothetical protein